MDSVRIDKYLWSIRVYKTRSEASDACNGGKVKLNGVSAKASKSIKIGDLIEVRKLSSIYSYKVVALAEKRMGAALVPNFAEDLTPESEKHRAPIESITFTRDRGTGRPTKKDRRQIENLLDLLED